MKKQEITNGSLGLALLRSAGVWGVGGGIKGLLFLVTQPQHHKELDAGVMFAECLSSSFLSIYTLVQYICSCYGAAGEP